MNRGTSTTRDLARVALQRLRPPAACEDIQDAALFYVGVLRELAAPLPAALARSLEPWTLMLEARRGDVIRELRGKGGRAVRINKSKRAVR